MHHPSETAHLAELIEAIRQLVLRTPDAKVDGLIHLTAAADITARLHKIDLLCVEIEAMIDHLPRYTLANVALPTKPPHRHVGDGPEERRLGQLTEAGQNLAALKRRRSDYTRTVPLIEPKPVETAPAVEPT